MTSIPEIFLKGLELLGIKYTEDQIGAFDVYLSELKKWNRTYNLTALRADEDIIIKHFLDSLLFLKTLPHEVQSIADIGTGAGFPGLPIKIMRPDIKITLIEPVQKKTLFLEHMKRTLKLKDLEIRRERIEDVKDLRVDVAVTRALFSIKDFIARTEGILNEKGMLVLSKGPKIEEELKCVDIAGIRQLDFVLPFTESIRHMVIVKK